MELFDKYVGRVFDNRYHIEKIIGIGGMAVVFEAEDRVMHRKVAVKMLKEEITNDTQSVKRFINESKAVSMLSHPNIVSIYDVSVKDNLKYIVMEHVEGITLKNYINTKRVLGTSEVLSYTEQILRALEHAHSKGIIHRDIKPQNIMLLKNGQIKVADFGIAKLPNAETVTMTDKAIGTVFYISPEQASGKAIDPRSDLYSLGVVMYEMATGKLPFTADTPVSVALKQVNEIARRPREINPQIPIGLEQIISDAMEKNPQNRFQSAQQMLKHIMQLKANPAIVFRKRTIPDKRAADKKRAEQRKKSDSSMLPIIAGVTTAFLLVLGVSGAVILSWLFSNERTVPYTITIPQYVGQIYDNELKNQIDGTEYYRLNVVYEYNAEIEKGKIISQNPESGERRKVLENEQYCDLHLVVSSGEETVVVKDWTVIDYRQAELEIKQSGLVPEIVREYHDSIGEGYVIRTEPGARAELVLGDSVKIYVSQGPEIIPTTVPDFRSKTAREAGQMLEEAGLELGEISYEHSPTYPEGQIMEQSETPHTEVPTGTEISFIVSLGKKPPETEYRPETDETETDNTETDDIEETEETTADTEEEGGHWWYVGRN